MNDEQGHGPNMAKGLQDMLGRDLNHFVQRVAVPLLGNAFGLYQQDSACPAIANTVQISPVKLHKFLPSEQKMYMCLIKPLIKIVSRNQSCKYLFKINGLKSSYIK